MINGSDLITQPYNTTFGAYIGLFGPGWIIIPLTVIAAALFVKTRDTALVSIYMIMAGAFMTVGSVWTGFIGASVLYIIFAGIGIAALMYNVFYGGR